MDKDIWVESHTWELLELHRAAIELREKKNKPQLSQAELRKLIEDTLLKGD